MAKRKIKAVSSKKKIVVPQVVESVTTAAPVKKPGVILPLLLAAFIIFTVVEIYVVGRNSILQSKKPVYVNSWAVPYKGYTSAGVYGDFMYVNDSERGDIYKSDVNTGNIVKLLTFPEGTYRVIADSKGNMYILTKKNEVIVVDGNTYKVKQTIMPEGIEGAIWIEVDSNDNFFLLSGSTGTIVKYSHDFAKIAAFGGHGSDRSSLNGPGKLFIGPKNEVFVLDTDRPGEMDVKIFDNDGKFISSWKIDKIKSFDALTNLALAPNGDTYINSFKDNKIFAFTSNGKYLGNFDADKDGRFQIINGAVLVVGGNNGTFFIFTHIIAQLKYIAY
jgi:WD40 repeat protein